MRNQKIEFFNVKKPGAKMPGSFILFNRSKTKPLLEDFLANYVVLLNLPH